MMTPDEGRAHLASLARGRTYGAGRLAPYVRETDQEWASGLVSTYPESWAGRLLEKWRERHGKDRTSGNLGHLRRCKAISAAMRAGVKADANDDQIRQDAAESARDMTRRLDIVGKLFPPESDRSPDQHTRMVMLAQTLEAWAIMAGRGIAAEFLRQAARSIPGALRRLCCERWWRAVLRKIHTRGVEATARVIGLVHKRAGCYVSNDTLQRRLGQRLRNDRALESVRAVNEHGQDFTLAELAARGPANRQIRRQELMVRIAGFELIAKQCGHEAYFVTVTCPSRMHAWRTKAGRSWDVVENKRHDGTQPDAAQAYLCQQWRRFNAAAARAGLQLYGFRIAEPNHDGTPHWHALLFFPRVAKAGGVHVAPVSGAGGLPDGGVSRRLAGGRERPAYRVAVRLLRRYFLWNDSAAERGARQHRVKVERIDWTRGSAAGYIAKYVSKNIDGYKVEKDLYGNDTMTSSQRVDAWASAWRIRQFQQIGGAPVGVWRELRRLHPEQEAAAPAIALALDAVNVAAGDKDANTEAVQRYTAANGWAAYLELQGGHRVPRRLLRLQVMRESSGEIGRYGDVMAPRAVGVVTLDVRRQVVPAFGIVPSFTATRTVRVEAESERATWLVVPGGFVEQARERLRGALAQGEALRPWSPVNNCTRPAPLFGAAVERVKKRGRWHRWNSGGRGAQPKEKQCPSSDPSSRASSPAF